MSIDFLDLAWLYSGLLLLLLFIRGIKHSGEIIISSSSRRQSNPKDFHL